MSRRGPQLTGQSLTEGGRIAPPLIPVQNTGPNTNAPGVALPAFNASTRVPAGITDPLVAARYAEAVNLNPASFLTTLSNGWHLIQCDRPMILWPISSTLAGSTGRLPNGTFDTGSVRVLNYAPGRIPVDETQAQRSKGAGICYFPNPGKWYVRASLDSIGESLVVYYLLIDAQDPAVAARYLSESGCHRIRTNTTKTVLDVTTLVLGTNRNRTGLVLTGISGPANVPPASQMRLAFGDDAIATEGTIIGSSTNLIWSQFGDSVWKGSVSAIYSNTNVAAYPAGGVFLSVIEYE